ncbi:MAG: hypothetical protein M5R36_10560 [Deltaproteobacteria bacterium]|nr:hypothetical protein [Deltaproteobacteria bacterium]
MKTFRLVLLMAVVACFFATPVLAQDDDTAGDDDTASMDDDMDDDDATGDGFSGTVEFDSPAALEANMSYEFNFRVTNTTDANAEGRHWIYLVEMFMPNADYAISQDLSSPDALHPGSGEWSAEPQEDQVTGQKGIRWQFTSTMTSAAYGDIEEGDFLDFSFVATTDDLATDGFDWFLWADSGEFDEGTAFVGGEGEDDDTGADDDLDDDGGDDDDDDDGCGC